MAREQVVRCLLIEPNPESALNEEAGRLFMEDYHAYAQRARLMTDIHAIKEGAASRSSAVVQAQESNKEEAAGGVGAREGESEGSGEGARRDGDDSSAELESPKKVSKTAAVSTDGDVKSSKAHDKKRSLRRL